MLFFHKLNKKSPKLSSTERKLISEHGRLRKSKKYNLKRYTLSETERETYLNVVPNLRPYYMDSSVTDITMLLPHVHTGVPHTIVNFYIETAGEKTTFWDGEMKMDDRYIKDDGNGYYNVKPELIQPVQSFVADPLDVYMIDPFRMHSVLPNIDEEKNVVNRIVNTVDREIMRYAMKNKRKLIQMFFELPIEKAVEKIYE